MAKLYAEMTSDKTPRKVSKGGDKYIEIDISYKNVILWEIISYPNGLIRITHNGKQKVFNSLNW